MIITTATTAATTTEQAAFRSALVAAFAKAAEIGEVRKRADGYEYKKIAAGKWQRLVGREHGKNKTPDTIPEPKKAPVKSGKPAPSAPAKSTSETPAAPAAPAAPAVEKYKADKTRIQSLAGPDLWANVVDGAPGASEAAMLVASLPDQFLKKLATRKVKMYVDTSKRVDDQDHMVTTKNWKSPTGEVGMNSGGVFEPYHGSVVIGNQAGQALTRVPTVLHEIGHAIDHNPNTMKFVSASDKAFRALADSPAVFESMRPYVKQYRTNPAAAKENYYAEVFADVFGVYHHNRAYAEKRFPPEIIAKVLELASKPIAKPRVAKEKLKQAFRGTR